MKIYLLIMVTLVSSALSGVRDFSQIYCFDDPEQIGFVVPCENEASYYYLQEGAILQSPLEVWHTGWRQGGITETGYIGFRRLDDALVSPLWADAQPALAGFTPLLEDVQGDHLFNNPSLDILSMKIAVTNERLFFSMQVAGNAFPTSSGFNYFAYMPVIVDPSSIIEENPIVYGLMYTIEIGSLISPGLYKITGTGLDGLTRLGNIEHSIEDNTLILSCAMADLLADADFLSWFDPQYPLFATTATTSRINLINGIQQADITEGINVLLKPQYLEGSNLSSPILSNAGIEIGSWGPYKNRARIDYQDLDHNVPRVAQVRVDDYPSSPLLPFGELDFAQTVTYKSEELEFPENWRELIFEFSDGHELVEHILSNPVSVSDETLIPSAGISLHPNPVRAVLHLKSQSQTPQSLGLYNLRGQWLQEIILHKGEASFDLTALPSGVYFLRGKTMANRRFVKL